jgi:L-asparagine oxygenase
MAAGLTTAVAGFIGEVPPLELTGDEGRALAALTQSVTQGAPALVDDPGWLAKARTAGCHLPPRLLETLRAFRHDARSGVLMITNLPVALDPLPATPSVPDSAERAATAPAVIIVLLGQQLGEIIAYRDEKHGALVQNVVPVPELARTQSNGGSSPLELHTENAFHPNRPDYVGLLCLRSAHEGVGTQVASIRHALPLLAAGEQEILRQPRFVTAAPPSFWSADRSQPRPVLTGAADDPDLCVDFHATAPQDPEAAAALTRLREALLQVRVELILRPGALAFLDNRLVVHGRGGFAPRYDGGDRWLHRVFVHLDHRRSRARRAGNGHVLV